MRTEIWKNVVIKGEKYERFQVSNLGRVMNLNYYNTGKAKLIEPFDDVNGYLCVNLYKNKETKNCYVHRLVAEAFLPNLLNKPCVNHKIEGDEGKTMNMVFFNEDETIDYEKTTIEWVTYKENNDYGTRTERSAKSQINGKTSKKVLQFTLDGEFIREWPSTHECERNGFNRGNIVSCCNGKLPHYKGFRWEYA